MRDRRRALLVQAALFLGGLAAWLAYWLSPRLGLWVADLVRLELGLSPRHLERVVATVATVAYVALFLALLHATRPRRP